MKLFVFAAALLVLIDYVSADGSRIVAAARSQLGVPYAWGGGGARGKSRGSDGVVGFDCSGLAQFAVFQGTGRTIARVASGQFGSCRHVPYAQNAPGDLVFFANGGGIYHVGIISRHNTMIDAPHSGVGVREEPVWAGHVAQVARCW